MYRGKLAEQFVAQELIASQDSSPFYWSREARSSSAEVDYLVVQNGKIVPIEVKSGKGGSLKSLHLLLNRYPSCKKGVVLYDGVYATNKEQRIEFWPLYSAGTIVDAGD